MENLSKKELKFSQKHLRLLSGLYGVLKPLDIIEPYRLEMGTKLESKKGRNLYDFWDSIISDEILKELDLLKSNVLINLASNEYFKSVKSLSAKIKVISPIFKDHSKGKYKIISLIYFNISLLFEMNLILIINLFKNQIHFQILFYL